MYNDILLPVDLNHESSWIRALPVAVAYCQAYGARLHVITVLPDFGMPIVGDYFPEDFKQQTRDDAAQQLHAFTQEHVPAAVPVQVHVAEGKAYREILHLADKTSADLIIMASHHPEFSDYLLGSTAERVVRHARQSVLVIRGPAGKPLLQG